MCKNCYEKFVERSGKVMLLCRLLEQNNESKNIMTRLCLCQRYCRDKDKYIPYQQHTGCKNFE